MLQKVSPGSSNVSSLSRMHELCKAGHAEIVLERYDEARVHFIEALGLRQEVYEPATIEYALLSLGSTYMFTDRYQEGIRFFSEYIARYSEDAGAYRERAGLLWYSGEIEKAIADYSTALKANAKDLMSLSSRGQVRAELGRHKEALENLDAALRELESVVAQNSSWSDWYRQIEAFVHNGRALALAGLERMADATAEFERSININAENAWVYHNRGTIREKMGELDLAISDYQLALQKKQPALSAFRTNQVKTRLNELLQRPR